MAESTDTTAPAAPGGVARPVDIGSVFRVATMLHRAGKLHDAEPLYRRVLAVDPRHVGAHTNIAVALQRLGRQEEAVAHYRQALSIAPERAEMRSSLGDALRTLGRFQEAVPEYQKALAVRPDDAGAHNNVAGILWMLGRTEEAIRHYEQAVALRADHAEAHFNLGNALHDLGRLAEAVGRYRQALAIRPGFAAARNNLGNTLQKLGRFAEAVPHYEQVLAIKADDADAHCNLGNALLALGRRQEAIAHYEQALAARPDFAEAHSNLGGVLQNIGRLEEAVASCRRALALVPDHAEAHNNLGNAYHTLGRPDEAIAQFEQALAVRPGFAAAHNGLGISLEVLGRIEEATRAYERAVALAPGNADFHLALAYSKRFTASDPRLIALEQLERNALGETERMKLQFALGKAFADLDRHDASLRHLLAGNALKRRQITYDQAETLRGFERIRATFTPELMQAKRDCGDASSVPVFVVGMPRSGTTLVEQILASHSRVFGAGELQEFGKAVADLEGRNGGSLSFPEVVARFSRDDLRRLGTDYLARIRAAAPTAERIVDKLPLNFCFVGLIHLALPAARIIHTRRDPVDTCVSCFSVLFGGDQPHTYDLGELGRYYRAYDALMQHWRQVLPEGVMLDVQYEDVVGDLGAQARRILAHCGLEWEDACLAFHQTPRPVRTASAIQVRQPIYRTSIGRWRAHGDLLRPLLEALGPGLTGDPPRLASGATASDHG